MSFKSLLNKVCDIELISFSPDASGAQNPSYAKLHANIPCRLRTRSTWERRYGDPAYQKSTHSLYMAFLNLTPSTIRVVLENEAYNVTGAADLGGAQRYLCLYLERIN